MKKILIIILIIIIALGLTAYASVLGYKKYQSVQSKKNIEKSSQEAVLQDTKQALKDTQQQIQDLQNKINVKPEIKTPDNSQKNITITASDLAPYLSAVKELECGDMQGSASL